MLLFNGHSNMGRKDSGIGPMRELFARDNTSRDRSCSNFTLSSSPLSKLFATMIRSSFVQSPNDAGNVSFIMFESSRSFRCEHRPMIAEIGPARSLLDNHNFLNKGRLSIFAGMTPLIWLLCINNMVRTWHWQRIAGMVPEILLSLSMKIMSDERFPGTQVSHHRLVSFKFKTLQFRTIAQWRKNRSAQFVNPFHEALQTLTGVSKGGRDGSAEVVGDDPTPVGCYHWDGCRKHSKEWDLCSWPELWEWIQWSCCPPGLAPWAPTTFQASRGCFHLD